MREEKDVLLFHRRDKGAVRKVVDLVSDLIALMFEIAKSGVSAASIKQRFAQLGERLADQGALPLEQLIELKLARNQA
jgi:hypothetical protein